MATTSIKVEHESDVTPPAAETTDFDDNTVRAIAEVYMNQGNEQYSKDDFRNATDFYTQGIKVNCKDEELNAKLYSNRATLHFFQSNYHDSLSDAKASSELQPSYLRAIIIGASACAHLNQFEEAIMWCDKGLAVDKNDEYLLELRTRCIKKRNKLQETSVEKAKNQSEVPTENGKEDASLQQAAGFSTQNVQSSKQLNSGVKALSYFNLRLAMAKEMGDKTGEGDAYGNLGNACHVLGAFKRALEYHKIHLRIAKEVGDKTGEVRANGNLGNAYQRLGYFYKATECHVAKLRMAKEMGDKPAEGAAYGSIGTAYEGRGDSKQAMYYHKIHLRIARDAGDKTGQSTALGHIGNAYRNLGDYKLAIEYHNEQLRIVKEVGNKTGEGDAYRGLGNAYQGLANFKEAIEHHKLHLSITKEVGDKAGKEAALGHLGNAYQGLGDFKMAIDYHEKHLTIAEEAGDRRGEATAYGNLGVAFRNLGDYTKAVEYHNLHLKIAKEMTDKNGEQKCFAGLGSTFQRLGDFVTAIDYHKLHLKIAKKRGDKAGQGAAYGGLGSGYQGLGEFRVAVHYHKLHLRFAKDVGSKKMEGAAYGNLGNAYQSLGFSRNAIDYHRLSLRIAEELEDRVGEGAAYGNLGRANQGLSDFQRAIDYHCRHLTVTKEVGDKAGEGAAYGQLGSAYQGLGDYQKAIDYHNLHLGIAKEVRDLAGEGVAYGNIGSAYQSLGDVKRAMEYQNLHIRIAREVGDQAEECAAYGQLGNAFSSLSNFEEAMDNYNQQLDIAKKIGDLHGEGTAFGNLGSVWQKLGDLKKAIHYNYLHLRIAKDAGDKTGEGASCGNLGVAFQSLGDVKKAIHYQKQQLRRAKEVGDRAGEGRAYHALSCSFETLCLLHDALEYSQLSVQAFNTVRSLLQTSKDEWKIYFRKKWNDSYIALRRILLKQERIVEVLFEAETGRAQALSDLLESQYGIQASQSASTEKETYLEKYFTSSSTIFLEVSPTVINVWVVSKGKDIHYRKKEVAEDRSIESLLDEARRKIHVDRWRKPSPGSLPKGTTETKSENPLVSLYNIVIAPIADQIQGDELIIVPDGPLWLAPYAAFVDGNSKFLCESFRIRLIPSLTSLKLIADSPQEYHSRNGALLVGDPWVKEVTGDKRPKLPKRPGARKEVEMIGEILKVTPLVGKEATKDEVLKRLSSVALVHIAANDRTETGEIVLSPHPEKTSSYPKQEDYLLTMEDVLNIKVRARLVVLSCCHSSRGEINPEGVVGIARAFLGAGARSVLVSLYELEDEATVELMRRFYHHLVKGRRASECLDLAMKCLRETKEYGEVRYWAPFVLIGDDVTLEFNEEK